MKDNIIPNYSDSLKNLLLFVGDLGKDERVPEDIRERAQTVAGDFMVAALFALASKCGHEKE